jgi:hypothetical protein
VIVIEGFFDAAGTAPRLFISADGDLVGVEFADVAGTTRFAGYSHAESWGKWSPSDALIFLDRPEVIAADAAAAADEPATMLGASLLGGAALGTLGAGAAGLAGASALVGLLDGDGGGGGGGGGNGPAVVPSVDGGSVVVTGDPGTQVIDVTGTAPEGSDVVVTIGDQVIETVADEDGSWEVVF